jgi:hypothetical protein
MQLIAIAALLVSSANPAAKLCVGEPTAEFRARFAPAPEGVPAESKCFVEFGGSVAIAAPSPVKPLDRHAVASGVCAYASPCEFRLSVLLLLGFTDDALVPVGVRYLMEGPANRRTEGFATAPFPGGAFTFYRHRGGAWTALPEGTAWVEEELFVSATAKYVAAQ